MVSARGAEVKTSSLSAVRLQRAFPALQTQESRLRETFAANYAHTYGLM